MIINWAAIVDTIAPEVIKLFGKTTAPAQPPAPPPSTPVVAPVPNPGTSVVLNRAPSAAIRELQHILNETVHPQPPLKEDGWLGPKTERALLQGLAMAKPYLASFGIST